MKKIQLRWQPLNWRQVEELTGARFGAMGSSISCMSRVTPAHLLGNIVSTKAEIRR
jgi:hypothetical protein